MRRHEQLSMHEHCITLYHAWEQDAYLYMQMELCQENLETFVAKRQLINESMVWNILVDLLLALKALHDSNLIHLDIKLENILINDNFECKLGDFGLVVDLNNVSVSLLFIVFASISISIYLLFAAKFTSSVRGWFEVHSTGIDEIKIHKGRRHI